MSEILFGVWTAEAPPPGLIAHAGCTRYYADVTHGAGAMLLDFSGRPEKSSWPESGRLGLGPRGDHRADVDAARYTLRVTAPPDASPIQVSEVVLSVRLFVPDSWQSEVREWLDQEHFEAMLAVPGCRWYRGYESVDGDGQFNFLNLWGLDAPEVIDRPAWAAARDTPWRERLLSAFADTRRAVYRLLAGQP